MRSLVLTLLLFTAANHAADLPGAGEDPGAARFYLPDDLEVTVWAKAPTFFNPSNIDCDIRGRIWVAEAVNYRDFRNKEGAQLWHEDGDRIMVLEDTDGDGQADKSWPFVQDKDLVAPLGVAVIGNRIFVSCSPNLIVYTDVNEDAKFDPAVDTKEILLTGFGGKDHDHSLHAVVAGPDGKLYFTVGNAGPHIVTDKSGWTLRAGSSYTGGSPHNTQNQPGLVSDDGRVWVGGLALRMNADGTGLEVIGHNFRNAYEVAVDSFGNVWQSDNDDTISCRVSSLMPYGNAGFASADGARTWQADQRPGQSIPTAHWHQEDPGVMPAGDIYGPGAPTGICMYENGSLPRKYEGMLLAADAGRNVIWGYFPQPQGAGFKLERFRFFSTVPDDASEGVSEQAKWFRPSDVCVGADGAIYIADFFDPYVGGHRMEDTAGTGTIYRITKKGESPKTPKIDLSTVEGQIDALRSPAVNVRLLGLRRSLDHVKRNAFQRGPIEHAAERAFAEDNLSLRARIGWLYGLYAGTGGTHTDIVVHDYVESRSFMYRVMMRGAGFSPAEYFFGEPAFEDPAVAAEVALSLRDVPIADAPETLLVIAEHWDGKDRWYLEAWGIGCEGKEEAVYPLLIEKLDGADALKWSDKLARLVWRIHPVACVAAAKERAMAGDVLDQPQRKQAIDTLAFIPTREAAMAMVAIANDGPEDLRDYAAWWVKHRSTHHWREHEALAALKHPGPAVEEKAQRRANQLRNGIKTGKFSPEEMKAAVMEMAGTSEGGANLIALVSRDELPPELIPLAAEYIYKNPDLTIRTMASQFFPRPIATGMQLPPIPELAKMKGEARKGRELFFGKAACMTCHRHGEQGGAIGPDMTAIGERFDRAAILDAMLNPSAAIALGYEAQMVTTTDGRAFTGFIVGDGATLIIKDLAGNQTAIPAKDVATRKPLEASIMPSVATLNLTPQEIADLLAFLMAE